MDPETRQPVGLRLHVAWQEPEQAIHLDGRPQPSANAPHKWSGFSTGHWERNTLVYETTHLKEAYLTRTGVPKSTKATVTTRVHRYGKVEHGRRILASSPRPKTRRNRSFEPGHLPAGLEWTTADRHNEDGMAIQIGQRLGHDFDEPLGLLSDCHRRIEYFLGVLIAIDTEAAGGMLTAAHRSALEGALRYFSTAAPRHTADEEDSLFPRLRASSDPAAAHALAMVEPLERDHDEADAQHVEIDGLVKRWLAEDRLSSDDAAELHERLVRLQDLYQRHISVEDRELFPAAARLLDGAQLREIGREMAARRDVRPRS